MKKSVFNLLLASGLSLFAMTAMAQDLDDLDDFDDMELMLDLDGMSKKEVQELADTMLKSPDKYSGETAIRVISHENLASGKTATRLYRAFKSKVTPADFEVVSESPLLRQGFTDPVIAGLLIRLAGMTKAPGAQSIILEAFRGGSPAYRAAAAEAIGLYGNKKYLPLLRKALDHYNGQPPERQFKEYGDGVIRGLLLLGDSQHLAGLLREAASASREVAETVLMIANGYTPPDRKHQAIKRLPGKRDRHERLVYDIIDLAPMSPKELASQVQNSTDPDVCDVLYRLLPTILSKENYGHFIPAVNAKNWDLRQLTLDLLTGGLATPQDIVVIRKQILDLYKGEDEIARAWAIRNSGRLENADRSALLSDVIKTGNRWERMEAVKEIQREPSKTLLSLLKDNKDALTDPDVTFHLSRILTK